MAVMSQQDRDNYIKGIIKKKREKVGANRRWKDDEITVRRESIYHYMGQGKSKLQLRVFLAELWDCTYRSAETYIKDAEEYLCQQDENTIQSYRKKMIEKLQRIADDAMKVGDRKSALAAYDQINKLNAAYTAKVEADIKGDIKFDFGE